MAKKEKKQIGNISYRDSITGEITATKSLIGAAQKNTGKFYNRVLKIFIKDFSEFLDKKKEI